MKKPELKLEAIRIKQRRSTIYLTFLEAAELAGDLTKPDAWRPDNPQGYQRPPKQSRFKSIAEYITRDDRGLLPQPILLNARDKLGFEPLEGSNFGILKVRPPLWEVDGQHRIGGIRRACQEDPGRMAGFMVPVAITENLPRIDEAVLFYVINTEQKRVPTDIAQRIIAQQLKEKDRREDIISQGKSWIGKATEIVDYLLSHDGQPWKDHIAIPGVKQSNVLIKQVSFVQSLKPIVDPEKSPIYAALRTEELGELLARYWSAIESVFQEAFDDPKNYVITRTVGVFPLHQLAPIVFDRVRTTRGRITKEALREILQGLGRNLVEEHNLSSPSDFWHKDPDKGVAGNYAGAKGFRILYDKLLERLPGENAPGVFL